MTTIQIKHRNTGEVLYECDTPEGTESGLLMRHALEKAVAAKADLRYADLCGSDLSDANLSDANLSDANLCYANLRYADLCYAKLRGANLSGAKLRGAKLRGANLSYAKLYDANLSGADLRGADLRGADLREGKKLVGARPVLTVGPIGSRNDCTTAYLTESGVYVRAGCFFDTLDQFEIAVEKKHGSNKHGCEYIAAVALIKAHAEIWTPKEEAQP